MLRYPSDAEGPRVRAVPAGEGESQVRDYERERRDERRRGRLPIWVAIPTTAGFMTVDPTGAMGLPWWSPIVAVVTSLSLLWWLFEAIDARREPRDPTVLARDCPIDAARRRWDVAKSDGSAILETADR